MSGWTALNAEDDISEGLDDADDSKELQLEEGFKLYQIALKLHSLGPAYYNEAQEAYQDLFNCEVFSWPEAQSNFDQQIVAETPVSAIALSQQPVLSTVTGGATAETANSLPQLIYLAYKSRAQFHIDFAQAQGLLGSDVAEIPKSLRKACLRSLSDSTTALERDDTDLDLWKRAAKVAQLLKTTRSSRFCLESVLAGDEEGEEISNIPGLDEAWAHHELGQATKAVGDKLSQMRCIEIKPNKKLLKAVLQSNDPYPAVTRLCDRKGLSESSVNGLTDYSVPVLQLELHDLTVEAVSKALLQALTARTDDGAPAGASLRFSLPTKPNGFSTKQDLAVELQQAPVTRGDQLRAVTTDQVNSQLIRAESSESFHSLPNDTGIITESAAGMIVESQLHSDHDMAEGKHAVLNATEPEQLSLPSRKRSSTLAGNDEPEARTKSKRIKARVSMADTLAVEEELTNDQGHIHAEQFANIAHADNFTYTTVNDMLARMSAEPLGDLRSVRKAFSSSTNKDLASNESEDPQAACGVLSSAILNWTEDKTAAFLPSSHGTKESSTSYSGLRLFVEHTKASNNNTFIENATMSTDQVDEFLRDANENGWPLEDICETWCLRVLGFGSDLDNLYLKGKWSDVLKETFFTVLLKCEAELSRTMLGYIRDWTARIGTDIQTQEKLSAAVQSVLAVFEILLDQTYTNQASTSPLSTDERYLLQRWAQYATDAVQLWYACGDVVTPINSLIIRYLWASVSYALLLSGSDKSHVLLCMEDLKDILSKSDVDQILLPNSPSMPVLSVEAIEQELSRQNLTDFFVDIFEANAGDNQYSLITKLEPVLTSTDRLDELYPELSSQQKAQIQALQDFLEAGNASLRLSLWKKLQDAYTMLSAHANVVSCMLRSTEVIADEITKTIHAEASTERYLILLRWLRDVDDLISKTVSKIIEDKTLLRNVDDEHLITSVNAVTIILRLIQEFVLCDDDMAIGRTPMPGFRTQNALKNFEKCREKFREMYVKSFSLLYLLLKEATAQMQDRFDNPEEDLTAFIRAIHVNFGERQYCKYANKLFVKLARTELLAMSSSTLTPELAQVLFDLYSLRLLPGVADFDHNCGIESLERDKQTAFALVPLVLDLADRLPTKELHKPEFKIAIEKIQGALGQVKPSNTALTFNRRTVTGVLKSLIDPRELLSSLKGKGEITLKAVHNDHAQIAKRGWYFLLGNLTLTKYKSAKRVSPTPTDDLDTAQAFFRLDIEHGVSSWETWYRLAQVFDAKIEDDMVWNALKLNEQKSEIVLLEKNAIHAYRMALAAGIRLDTDDQNVLVKIQDMFFDFATRLYASSRAPLSMEAFNTDKAIRHLSHHEHSTMSKVLMIKPMTKYMVWKLAARLIEASLAVTQTWQRYYLLSKCYWKMWQSSKNKTSQQPVQMQDVVRTMIRAVRLTPRKDKATEPILEPHLRLVSVVYKLYVRGELSKESAVDILKSSHYAENVELIPDEDGLQDFDRFALSILKKLQSADKQGWHHRIFARAAHIMFANRDVAGALGAKFQMTQQIFTKTMTLQVWKPENERAGRHYVYTGRYLRFFVEVLSVLKDRANLEQVVRRLRRRNTDFLNHEQLWEDAVTAYLRLLRSLGDIPPGKERDLFDNISYDKFTTDSDRLEKWAHDPDNTNRYQDILHDAVELKKLNNSLFKATDIDDLIGDTYAYLYEVFLSKQTSEPKEIKPLEFVNTTAETPQTPNGSQDRLRMNNLLSLQVDPSTTKQTSLTGLGIVDSIERDVPTNAFAQMMPEKLKPGKPKTITKKEIQKKAEQILVKPPPIKTPTLNKRLIINVPATKPEDSDMQSVMSDTNVPEEDTEMDASRMVSRNGSPSLLLSTGLNIEKDTKQDDKSNNSAVNSDDEGDADVEDADEEEEIPESMDGVEEEERESPADVGDDSTTRITIYNRTDHDSVVKEDMDADESIA